MTAETATPAPEALRSCRFPTEVLEVLRTLRGAGFAAYLVGGSVRDLLLGNTAKDFDVATSARAERVVQLFRRVVPTGIKHGTVTVLVRKHAVEVTTFRGEGAYKDGRRPERVFFLENVVEDLARRDFTINAMAYDPTTEEFVDPFEGKKDLERRLIRCVGEPRERFSEDGLRPLRAVRFASVLGFDIDRPTLDAIPATLATFDRIARERVREELVKLLLGPDPARGIALLRETDLLERILPELHALAAGADAQDRFARTLGRVRLVEPRLELRLAALLHDTVDGLEPASQRLVLERALERLRLPRKTADAVVLLVAERRFGLEPAADDAAARHAIARVGAATIDPLLALARAEASARTSPELLDRLSHTERRIRQVLAHHPPLETGDLAIDGRRVMQLLGAGPGPQVGDALRFLLDAVLDDPALNRPESLASLLRQKYARR